MSHRLSEAKAFGISGLDEETQHTLFPSVPLPAASAEGNVWKWSDIGTAPALHQFAQYNHKSPAAPAAATAVNSHATTHQEAAPRRHDTAAHEHLTEHHCRCKSKSRRSSPNCSCNRSTAHSPDPEHYLVGLRWDAPSPTPGQPPGPTSQVEAHSFASNNVPSPRRFLASCHHGVRPLARQWGPSFNPLGSLSHPSQSSSPQLQSDGSAVGGRNDVEGRLRSASPSVARACVTLPGFCSPSQQVPAEQEAVRDLHSKASNIAAGKCNLDNLPPCLTIVAIKLLPVVPWCYCNSSFNCAEAFFGLGTLHASHAMV